MPKQVATPALFVASGISQYLGAAIGVGLFTVLAPSGVAWWRLALGALVLIVVWRPWQTEWTRRRFFAAMLFGSFLGGMNILFYEAIARLPLGAAVSLEFVGPVCVALIGGAGVRSRIAAVLAFAGVIAIGGLGVDLNAPGTVVGMVFALAAAAMWAGYIVVGQKVATRGSAVSSLAVGCFVVSVATAPFLLGTALAEPLTWKIMLSLLGVAVLSTVIPYSVEAVALKRISAATFALLTALLPATSTVVGFLALGQNVTVGEILGLVLISSAVWLATAPENRGEV